MNLESFVKTKKANWYRLESLVTKHQGAERLSDNELSEMVKLYRSACADYAYACSAFPYDRIIQELNSIIGRSHNRIYGKRNIGFKAILRFYFDIFPCAFRANVKYVLLSFFVFFLGMALSFSGSFVNPNLPRIFMGEQYVEMTQQNINQNDPFAVYSQSDSPVMSGFIMTNNIKVTFFAFGMGILAGIGTLYVLFYNGLLLGVFFFVFYQCGLLLDSLLTVMMHGTLELASIFIAGGAGLMIGKALLFPESYSRKEALMLNGYEAVKLILGILPFLAIAAIIEGFVTRLDLPVYIKTIFIFFNVLILIWYFFRKPHSYSP